MKAALGLGSNLGDRLARLRAAVEALGGLGRILAVSPLYETAPVGGPDQGRFLNAVVVLETDLDPSTLLGETQGVEAEQDRVRAERWGPRTLDIDILATDGPPVDSDLLTIPHPRARDRRFVLAPLTDVWPDAPVGDSLTAQDALRRLRGQRVRSWSGDWVQRPPGLGVRAKLWVAAQLVLLVLWAGLAFAGGAGDGGPGQVGVGLVVTLASGVLGFWALRSLGRELTPYPQPRDGARLVEAGPYRLARHPIYGAIVLGALGVSLAQGSWPALAGTAVLALFFWLKSSVEETALTLTIPAYREYRNRVRRRLIPWVL